MEPQVSPASVVYLGCVIGSLVLFARRFPSGALLNRVMVTCVVCVIATVLVDISGGPAAARLGGAAGLPTAVVMGAVVLFVVLRLRFSQ